MVGINIPYLQAGNPIQYRTRDINGNYVSVNPTTGQQTNYIPEQGTIRFNAVRSVGGNNQTRQGRLSIANNQAQTYNRRQRKVHNYADTRIRLKQKHQRVNVKNGEPEIVQDDYTPAVEAPTRIVSPEFDLLTLGRASSLGSIFNKSKYSKLSKAINKEVDNADISESMLYNQWQDLTHKPATTMSEILPEFNQAIKDPNYVFGRQSWPTVVNGLPRHKLVFKTQKAPTETYISQFKYPLGIQDGKLVANHEGFSRAIWLSENRPYMGTPSTSGVSNSSNYTYIMDSEHFQPSLTLKSSIGSVKYEYPGASGLPIEHTQMIQYDPILKQYTKTRFVDEPKMLGMGNTYLWK